MKIPKQCKIELATSQDPTRPALAHPEFDPEASALVATNGRIMAVIPVVLGEGDVAGPISAKALARSRKLSRKESATQILASEQSLKLSDGSVLPRPKEGPFPQWRLVLPTSERGTSVCINAHDLRALADALGSERVVLHLDKADPERGVVRVTPADSADSKAVAGAYGVIILNRP